MAPSKIVKPTGLDSRFQLADGTVKNRIIAGLAGEIGTWKTSWGLGMPAPLLVQSLDQGTEGIAEPLIQKGKKIYLTKYSANTNELREIKDDDERMAAAEEIASQIEDDFLYAIANGIRSILWDKENQVYDIVKYAELGAPSDAPSNYYPIHQRLEAMIAAAKESDINFVCIRAMKTPWVSEVKGSGKIGASPSKTQRIPAGWGRLEEQMHLNIINRFVEEVDDEGAKTLNVVMDIGKSRGPGGRDIQNTTIPYTEFAEFATAVFPDTSQEDWE
jgi:hypothetical protein